MSKRLLSLALTFALLLSMLFVNGTLALNAFADIEESVKIVNGSFEDGLPAFTAGAANSSIVSESADGSKALKVVNSSVFRVNVDTDALKTVDVSRSYKLQFSAKADGSFNGKIYINSVKTKTGSARSVYPFKFSYRAEIYAVNNADISAEWNTYTTENLSVCGTEYYFDFNVSGSGTVIIDDLKLVPVDEANIGGTVTYSYNEETGKSVLTAHANEGYRATSVSVTMGNGWDSKAVDVELLSEDAANNTISYTYDHNSHIYGSNDGKAYVTAEFSEMPDTPEEGVISLNNGGFENGSVPPNWGGTAEIVSGGYKSNSALKLESGMVFFMYMNQADLNNIDINRRYFLRFKAKASSDYSGSVRIRLKTTSGSFTDSAYSGMYADTFDAYLNSSLTTDWQTYTTTDSFVLCGADASFGFYTDLASGSVTIDNVEIVPAEESDPHGTVTYSFDSESGTRTITAHPIPGYVLESISLKDRFNADIPLTKVGETGEDNAETYTFEHKSYVILSNVKNSTRFVTVNFVEAPPENTVNGGITNGGFESGKPGFVSSDSGAELVNDAKEGSKALKLNAGHIFRVSVDSETLKALDVSRAYTLKFYAKASDSFNGKLFIKDVTAKIGDATARLYPFKWAYRTEIYALGKDGNQSVSTEWTEYTTEQLSVCGTEYYFDFNVTGTGSVIIDDLRLVPVGEENEGGTVTYSYNSELAKSVLTAHAKEGYKPSKITVTLAKGWDSKTFDAELLSEDTENNLAQYTYNHDSAFFGNNDGKAYITAVFEENSDTPPTTNGGIVNGGFESGKPGFVGSDSGAELVNDAKEGSKALKLNAGHIFRVSVDSETLKALDVSRAYTLKFYAKASDSFNGKLFIKDVTAKIGDATARLYPFKWAYRTEIYALGKDGNQSVSTEWTEYATEQLSVCGTEYYFDFYVSGTGSVIIDDLRLVPVDEENEGGTVTYSYNAETGKSVLTAHAKEGYKPSKITVTLAKGWDSKTFDAELLSEDTENNLAQYTYNHDSAFFGNNDGKAYITAVFEENSDTPPTTNGGIVNGGFESGKPGFVSSDSGAELVNDAKEGSKALKLNAGHIFRVSVDSETLKALDVSRAYTLKFYAKASDSFNGKLFIKDVKAKTGSARSVWPYKYSYRTEFYALGKDGNQSVSTEWTEYTTEQLSVCGTEYYFDFYVSGTGSVIIDDLRLVAVDEENEGGTVTYSYDEATGKSVLTAHAKEGYKPSKITVTLANGWDSKTFDAELLSADTENNTAQYTYNHDSALFGDNGGKAYVTAEFELADTSDFVYDGNVANGGFEKKPWSITNKKDQIVSIDTENTFNNSLGSLKVEMSQFYKYPNAINFNSYSLPEVAQSLDTSKKYCVALWLKTSDDFNGSVYVRVAQKGEYKWFNWQTELHFIGGNNEGETGYKDWTRLYCPAFEVTKDDISLTLITDGVGTVWIDDVEIVEDPQANNYIGNGGFEEGPWSTWGSEGDSSTKSTTVVKDVTNGSAKAGKMTSSSDGEFFIVQGNKKDINVNDTYRFSIDLKTEDVAMDGVTVRILQWFEDENGETVTSWLRLYGSEEFIKAGGTTDWTTYSINAKGFAKNLKNITLYIYLKGKGTVWIDNVSMTVKEKAEVEAGNVGADVEPGEVNALDVVHLYTSDEETDIYYTVDGSDPRTSQTALLQDDAVGIIITEDTLVRAYAVGEETQSEVFDFNYKCSGALFEDDKMWDHMSSQGSLDTSVYKVGNNSLLLQGNGNKAYACTGIIAIDPAFDYKVEFWAKTDGMEQENSSNINLFLIGGAGADQAPCGDRGAYFGNKDKLLTLKSGDDWKHYEFVIDKIDGFYSGLSLIASIDYDFGNLWIDGIKVTAIQKQNWALTVSGDGNVWGNNYYESLVSNFEIEQGFLIGSSANVMENGTLAYKVYNDDDPDDILVEGDTEINVMPHATTTSSINLSSVAKYGTFTVEFLMTNSRGLTYPAGTIKLARLRDDSEINKDSMFGVCVNYEQMDYDTLDKTGVGVVRFDLDWEDVEISEGNYRIKQSVIDAINRGNELGIDTMVIFNSHHWPSWYTYEGSSGFPKTNAQIEMFMGYVRYVVNYFGDKVKYYELFNETNFMPYSAVDGAGYTKLLKRVYTAIKEISPNSKVIGGVMASVGPGQGVDLNYGEAMIDAGAADYMDYMSFHPYIQPYSPESVNWADQIQQMQDMIKRKTGKVIPFIFTEIGWSAYYGNTGVTEEQKMNYFVRSYAWADSLGYVDRIVIYREGSNSLKYNFESKWGVFNSFSADSGTANPLGVAMANFVYMKNQFDFSEKVQLADNLYAFKYTGNANNTKKDMYMIWTDDVEALGAITTSDTSAKLYDAYGNIVSIDYQGNTFNADISGRPIYITLNKGSVITGIKFVNSNGSDPENNNSGTNNGGTNNGGTNESILEDNKSETNSGDTNESSLEDNSSETNGEDTNNLESEEETENSQVKKVVKSVKKVVKKGKSSDKFNWIPIIIVAASVAVAAGATAFLIVFIKKRKKKLSI